MDWIQVTITTTSAGVEPVTGRLYRLGITGVEIEDEKEFNDFLSENTKYWDYVDEELRQKMAGDTRVKVYVSDNATGRETLLSIRDSMRALAGMDTAHEFGKLEITLSTLKEEDWANNWKQYFKPIAIGSRVLIMPEWEPTPADTQGRVVFTVNPGMTFGTGSHYSTQLCIEAIEEYLRPDDAVLDLGCGSGILSIIALLLGASRALAVDLDPNAVPIALANAKMNGVGEDRYTVLSGDLTADQKLIETIGFKKYDMVYANIVADVIMAIVNKVKRQLKEDGIFISSGIIKQRQDEVLEALRKSGFKVLAVHEKNDWVAIASCINK